MRGILEQEKDKGLAHTRGRHVGTDKRHGLQRRGDGGNGTWTLELSSINVAEIDTTKTYVKHCGLQACQWHGSALAQRHVHIVEHDRNSCPQLPPELAQDRALDETVHKPCGDVVSRWEVHLIALQPRGNEPDGTEDLPLEVERIYVV